MTYEEVYDFCLDWQMGYIDKKTLVAKFIARGWRFYDFKELALQNGWFVVSMENINANNN